LLNARWRRGAAIARCVDETAIRWSRAQPPSHAADL